MEFTRLGIIDLFGILTPGVFLLGNIILILYGIGIFAELLMGILRDPFLAIVVIFFVGYLLGSILRLFPPKRVDSLVSLYLLKIKKYRWAKDNFPYYRTLLVERYKSYNNVLSKVADFILEESGMEKIKDYSQKEDKSFFNYCKLLIRENSSPLSAEIYRMEALVRLLSGVFLSSCIGLCGFVVVLILNFTSFIATPTDEFIYTYLILSVLYLTILLAILKRFRFIRFTEVMTVWVSFYLVRKEKLTWQASRKALNRLNPKRYY